MPCCRRSASSSPAPRGRARELARVCRPGGTIGLVNWTPEGQVGEVLRTIGRHMAPLPGFASPPPLWGSEQHVRALFADAPVQLEFAGIEPLAVRLTRALRRVHAYPLRPDAEGA